MYFLAEFADFNLPSASKDYSRKPVCGEPNLDDGHRKPGYGGCPGFSPVRKCRLPK
jgi:hypothetical protein